MSSRVPKEFEIGDIVLVERNGRKVRKSEKWNNSWTDDMDGSVGKCQVIKSINQYGVHLEDNFGYPPSVLRLIRRGKVGFFKKGEKVFIAGKPEDTVPTWNSAMKVGAVLTVVSDTAFAVEYQLSDGYWYGCDCFEPYTNFEPQKVSGFTINEPLQEYELF